MTWTIPNLITLVRLILSALLLAAFYLAPNGIKIWVFIAFALVNNALDIADGAAARRLDMATATGKFLDATGDRLVKTVLMCMLSHLGVFPWLLTAAHLGVKNQFFELPSFFVEGYLNDIKEVKRRLPLYYALTYYKPWIAAGVVFNHVVWGLLIVNAYNYPILSQGMLGLIYVLFLLHVFARVLPLRSIYAFLGQTFDRPAASGAAGRSARRRAPTPHSALDESL